MKNPLLTILAAVRSMREGLIANAIASTAKKAGWRRPGTLIHTRGCHGSFGGCTRAERILIQTGVRTDHLQHPWERDGYASEVHMLADRYPATLRIAAADEGHPWHTRALEAKRLKLLPEISSFSNV